MEGVRGATDVSLRPYSVTLQRGSAFGRDEVLQAAWETLRMWLSLRVAPEEPFTQMPTLRQDIALRQCSACREEQDRAMEEFMRDFDTLEY